MCIEIGIVLLLYLLLSQIVALSIVLSSLVSRRVMERFSLIPILEALFALLVFHNCLQFFTSPIRHVPGPFWARFTNLWRLLNVYTRHAEKTQRQLHDRYGSAVRLGPIMISISDPDMIDKIYSRKSLLRKVRACGAPLFQPVHSPTENAPRT